MKINNFRGDLSDISAKKEALIPIVGRERQNRKKSRPAYVRDPKRTRTRTQVRTSGLTPSN